MLGNGAAMGFTPAQVRAESLWSFLAALDGWMAANSPDGDKGLTAEEADELWKFIEEDDDA